MFRINNIIWALGIKLTSDAYFAVAYGPILLTNLACTGTEASLLECNQKSCGITSCTHSNDAGIICERKLYIMP